MEYVAMFLLGVAVGVALMDSWWKDSIQHHAMTNEALAVRHRHYKVTWE